MDLVCVESDKEILSSPMKVVLEGKVEVQETMELHCSHRATWVLEHQELQAGDDGIYK